MKKGPNLSRGIPLGASTTWWCACSRLKDLADPLLCFPGASSSPWICWCWCWYWSQMWWCLWGKVGSWWFLIFTSQWPQTEDTIGKRVFPRRPENATPRYLGLLLWTEIKLKANIRRSKKQSRKTYLSLTIKDMVPKSMSSSIRIVSGTLTDLNVLQLCWCSQNS